MVQVSWADLDEEALNAFMFLREINGEKSMSVKFCPESIFSFINLAI